jgi:hypothetical protein
LASCELQLSCTHDTHAELALFALARQLVAALFGPLLLLLHANAAARLALTPATIRMFFMASPLECLPYPDDLLRSPHKSPDRGAAA